MARHWKINEEVRKLVRERSKGICEDCKINPAEHMHHWNYDRKGQELPEDIEHLCVVCHGKHHPKLTFRTNWEQRQIHFNRELRKLKRRFGMN